MNNNYIENSDEAFYAFIDDNKEATSNKLTLPEIAARFTEDAVMASNYNNVPSSLAFFTLLGQLCKDMVAIPSGVNKDDIRLHFLWLQTSGTGKSTLTNWFKPIVERTFNILNTDHGQDFNIFDVTDYTDAALIGSMENAEEQVQQEDGSFVTVQVARPTPGQLEGDGLAMWDEFEYSGIFKQSQHKENSIVYLNTFMNTLWGSTWIIKKKLKLGDEPLECKCKRSSFATSYIPKQLTTVITEKGVLQRMLIFIWEVPQHQQQQMRRRLISDWGTIKSAEEPLLKYADAFVKLFEVVKERYEEVDCDPLKVVTITKQANDALVRECVLMEEYITDSRQEVFEAMETFINRILKHIQKLAVLCCIAEAPSIKDKSKRFVVTQNHVLQASSLVRQCYKSLVSWLDEALRVEHKSMANQANYAVFKKICKQESDSDGWIHKAELFSKVRQETQKGAATIYKWWPKVSEYFETKKISKSTYVRLKEDVNNET
mgnify:CR=1 FL=1|tara:strand:- start:1655 stop:3118 length:1464 start_codon:yes stop_codon:yes gene_type:complete